MEGLNKGFKGSLVGDLNLDAHDVCDRNVVVLCHSINLLN